MLLKKAGMIVLGTAAGVAALSGTAFAGEANATPAGHDHGHHHHHGGWDRDNDNDRGGRDNIRFGDDDNSVRFSDDDFSPSARSGDQTIGQQRGLVNVGNTNVQAPINAVLSVLGETTNL